MARTSKDARPAALASDEQATEPLSAVLAEALATAPNGPVHGALVAIETALTDLKRRATSVEQHLDAEYAPILERIKAL